MNKVLIVDDSEFMRMTIRNMVVKHGFEVIAEAVDGIDGIKMYKELKPDIVTMDITMPDMSGLAALKEIMTFDPDAKVVMISAMGQERLVMQAILIGASSFIVKPFKEDQIISTINKLV